MVVSSTLYHDNRPDVILGVLTSQLASARTPTDYLLTDWQAAGLHQPSAFRAYFAMASRSAVRPVGRLSERDWLEVQACLARALAVGTP